MTRAITLILMLTALLHSAAIFGFFYAWVCSTMWGLDAAEPATAIAAMQAMNASVRNAVFAPAFFATPLLLILAGALLWTQQRRSSATFFGLAGLVYLFGGLVLTMAVNVPMNEALALVTIPDDANAAAQIWNDYSGPWQFWNQTRTVASGISFLLAAWGAVLYRPVTMS